MATPAEAVAYLRQNFKILSENGSLLSFGWNLEGGRTQLVIVEVRDNLLRILSRVAKGGTVSAEKLLTENDSIWGVALLEGDYYLTHTVLLENADANEIAGPLEIVAIHADELEEKLGLGDEN
jgi:hypothetical protein